MSSTSIEPDRIKASGNRLHNGLGSLFLSISREAILALPVLSGLHHDYREIRLTAEGCTKKRRAPGDDVSLIREVVDPQSRSPCFSDDDDKQGVYVFP